MLLSHPSILVLIPTQFGGGAEKIFGVLKHCCSYEKIEFVSIWGGEESVCGYGPPGYKIIRILTLLIAALKINQRYSARFNYVACMLPLSLITGVLYKFIHLGRGVQLVYCRRNNYKLWSSNGVLETIFLPFVDVIHCCSNELVKSHYKNKKIIIEANPIPLPNNSLAINGNRICFVGRFVDQKRPELALAAYAGLNKSRDSSSDIGIFDMYGVGPLHSKVTKLIENFGMRHCVHLKGYVDHPFDTGHYSILIHTSHYEGSPNTIYEALSRGLIVVCKRSLEGISMIPTEIMDTCMVLVDEVDSENVSNIWKNALQSAITLEMASTRKQRIRMVSMYSEDDTAFTARFFSKLFIDPSY